MPPGGLPEAYLEGGPESLQQLVARFARGRGPFTAAEAAARFGVDLEAELRALEREDRLVRGELRPGGTEREWCDPDVLRRLRRASLAVFRREVEPAEQAALGALPAGVARHRPARDPARGARAAAGAGAAGVALGGRGAGAARAGVPPGVAGRPVRERRAGLGRRRARPRGALLPRGRAGARPPLCRRRRPRARPRRRSARRSHGARSSGSTCSLRPVSRRTWRCPRCGSSSGPAR